MEKNIFSQNGVEVIETKQQDTKIDLMIDSQFNSIQNEMITEIQTLLRARVESLKREFQDDELVEKAAAELFEEYRCDK